METFMTDVNVSREYEMGIEEKQVGMLMFDE